MRQVGRYLSYVLSVFVPRSVFRVFDVNPVAAVAGEWRGSEVRHYERHEPFDVCRSARMEYGEKMRKLHSAHSADVAVGDMSRLIRIHGSVIFHIPSLARCGRRPTLEYDATANRLHTPDRWRR